MVVCVLEIEKDWETAKKSNKVVNLAILCEKFTFPVL